ncbi:hypothetical protein FRC12_009944 [Ceratobasidium sp. 428]|nr:hypothetical protein FRC09_013403 [Ceratobasidium sp. 395]KAG8758676.1 hypothetical protein FRC12_009944 [Ceratobasidium sp. 428]
MADFFATTAIVDKLMTTEATTQRGELNASIAAEVTENANGTTQNPKGSNFSMCEIIM